MTPAAISVAKMISKYIKLIKFKTIRLIVIRYLKVLRIIMFTVVMRRKFVKIFKKIS